jgi:predicted MFS family arabinose efflux permease
VLGLARLLTGLAQGLYFANDRPIIAAATPRERLARGLGVSFSGLGLGTTLGIIAGGALGERLPWRSVFLVLAFLPLLSAWLIARLIPDPIRDRTPQPTAPDDVGVGPADVFRQRTLWLLGLAGMAPIWTQWLIGTWGPLLFAEVGAHELTRSALYASLLGIAALPGLFTIGSLSDYLVRRGVARHAVMAAAILCMALSVAAMGVTVQRGGPIWLLAVLVFVASFFVWGGWGPAYAMMAEMFPQRVLGLVYGLVSATCFVSALLAPYFTGWVKDVTGSFAGGCYLAAALGLLGAPVALAIGPVFHRAATVSRAAGTSGGVR